LNSLNVLLKAKGRSAIVWLVHQHYTSITLYLGKAPTKYQLFDIFFPLTKQTIHLHIAGEIWSLSLTKVFK